MKGQLILLLLYAALASAKNLNLWSHLSRDGLTVVDSPAGVGEEESSLGVSVIENNSNYEEDTEYVSTAGPVANEPSVESDENNELASSCEESSFLSHENCNQFYICAHGVPVALSCPGDLLYDPESESCEWPSSVHCDDRIIPGFPENPESIEGVQTTAPPPLDIEPPTVEFEEDHNNIEGDRGCQYNGQIIPNENCKLFSLCAHGVPVTMNCPEDLLFNPEINTCDWPRNVDCGDRIIPEFSDDETEATDEETAPEVEEMISSTEPTITQTTAGDIVSTAAPFDPEELGKDSSENENGVNVIDTPSAEALAESDEETADDQSAGNDDICDLSRGFDGHAYPHEYCHQFYLCAHGTATPMVCPWILLFNPETRRCDWPRNVDCGDRTIPVEFA